MSPPSAGKARERALGRVTASIGFPKADTQLVPSSPGLRVKPAMRLFLSSCVSAFLRLDSSPFQIAAASILAAFIHAG